jgi:Type IV secretion system pilin
MRRILTSILGTLLLFPLFIQDTFGVGIDTYRNSVYRPDNLPATDASAGGVEYRVSQILQFAINLLLYASGSAAVVMLVYGGIRYITSFGQQEAMDSAKKTIKYALFGLVAVILAYAAVTNIISLIYKATA